MTLQTRAKLLALTMAGRNPLCSVGEAMKGHQDVAARDLTVSRFLRECRVVRREDNGLQLWETPKGVMWAPSSTGGEALSLVLAEQEHNAYGDGQLAIKNGFVVLDCGANVGVFSRHALEAGATTVIAVEPSQENAECLRRNLAGALTDGRAQICQKGLWDEAGMLTLAIDPHNAGGNSFITKNKDSYDAYQVPVLTIDQLVKELKLERVDFVKMDIEAAEQKALLGARETLTRFRPRLAIAVEHTPDRLGNAKAVIEIVRGIRPDYRVSGGHCYVSENNVILPEILYFQ